MTAWKRGEWSDGLAEWIEGDTAFLSIVFSWKIEEAYARALWHRAAGRRVMFGGPGVWHPSVRKLLLDVAEYGPRAPDALQRHNPMATKASEGCPVGCWYCIVPPMEGREFTLLPDFTPRPVLTDNNLSALPADYQQHIVDRYLAAGVPLLDANSGFEPKTFDGEVYERWAPINRGPWRFGSDDALERDDVERVLRMLRQRGVGARRIQVYTMIGHEPFDVCMDRIQHVLDLGGEPYAQKNMKLNTLTKEPWVRHDWTPELLGRVQRWVNRRGWRSVPFGEYDASAKTANRLDPPAPDLFA